MPPPRSAVRPYRGEPSAVTLACSARFLEELLDEPALTRIGHGFADHLACRGQGQVGDLGPEVGDRPLLLGLDIARRALAHPLELLTCGGDVGVSRLLGDALRAIDDLVRVASRLIDRVGALLLRRFATATRLFGVLQPLLDALPTIAEHPTHRAEPELV